MALRLEEGVGHAATNDQRIDLVEQVLDHTDFIGNLCATKNGNKRAFRIVERLAHDIEFFLDKEAAHGRQIIGQTGGGGMRAMRGAKGVIDKQLGHGCQFLGERRIILRLFLVEADILEHQDYRHS